jgi:hypothetical protein
MNAIDAFKMIGETTFRPFTDSDWKAFQGCETQNPMIGENGQWAIVIDGDEVTFCSPDMNWFTFKLNFLYEN